VSDIEHIKDLAFNAGYQQREKELQACKSDTPDDALEAFEQTRQELQDLKQFIAMQGGGHVRNQLLNLPDRIKEQSLEVAEISQQIEKVHLWIAHAKNEAFELISEIREEGKPKYSNEKARTVAQEKYLVESQQYLDNCDALGRLEWQLKTKEIELGHSQNLFRACLAVAGMQGVR